MDEDIFPTESELVCRNTDIQCATGFPCTVRCQAGVGACRGSRIDASDAQNLTVISGKRNSFVNSEVFCPVDQLDSTQNGGKCSFQSRPVGLQSPFSTLRVIAVNGFADDAVEFDCTQATCLSSATMNCTTTLQEQCNIDTTVKTGCEDGSICIPTSAPTADPSTTPTT